MTNQVLVSKILNKFKPDIIINCSGYTDVDGCEKNPNQAIKENFLNNINLCEAYEKLNKTKKHIIHFSTDQVYNQIQKQNIEQNECLINTYAYTKFLGELPYKKLNYSTILRTNFFGKSLLKKRISYSDWVIKNLNKNKKIYVSDKTVFNPILIENLIKILEQIINKKLFGIFNLGSSNSISKYEFAKILATQKNLKISNIINKKIKNKNSSIRPKYMAMNCSKIAKKLKITLPKIEDQIIAC